MNRRNETVSFGRVTWLLLVVAGIALLHPGYSTAASFLQTPRKYLAVYNNNNNKKKKKKNKTDFYSAVVS